MFTNTTAHRPSHTSALRHGEKDGIAGNERGIPHFYCNVPTVRPVASNNSQSNKSPVSTGDTPPSTSVSSVSRMPVHHTTCGLATSSTGTQASGTNRIGAVSTLFTRALLGVTSAHSGNEGSSNLGSLLSPSQLAQLSVAYPSVQWKSMEWVRQQHYYTGEVRWKHTPAAPVPPPDVSCPSGGASTSSSGVGGDRTVYNHKIATPLEPDPSHAGGLPIPHGRGTMAYILHGRHNGKTPPLKALHQTNKAAPTTRWSSSPKRSSQTVRHSVPGDAVASRTPSPGFCFIAPQRLPKRYCPVDDLFKYPHGVSEGAESDDESITVCSGTPAANGAKGGQVVIAFSLFEGRFVDGQREGFGRLTVYNRYVLECAWKEDAPVLGTKLCTLRTMVHPSRPAVASKSDKAPPRSTSGRMLTSFDFSHHYVGMLSLCATSHPLTFAGCAWTHHVNFVPHGVGEEHTVSDGKTTSKRCGQWNNGRQHGFVAEVDALQRLYLGRYADGARDGPGSLENLRTGAVFCGMWKCGEMLPGANLILPSQPFFTLQSVKWANVDALTFERATLVKSFNPFGGIWEPLFEELDKVVAAMEPLDSVSETASVADVLGGAVASLSEQGALKAVLAAFQRTMYFLYDKYPGGATDHPQSDSASAPISMDPKTVTTVQHPSSVLFAPRDGFSEDHCSAMGEGTPVSQRDRLAKAGSERRSPSYPATHQYWSLPCCCEHSGLRRNTVHPSACAEESEGPAFFLSHIAAPTKECLHSRTPVRAYEHAMKITISFISSLRFRVISIVASHPAVCDRILQDGILLLCWDLVYPVAAPLLHGLVTAAVEDDASMTERTLMGLNDGDCSSNVGAHDVGASGLFSSSYMTELKPSLLGFYLAVERCQAHLQSGCRRSLDSRAEHTGGEAGGKCRAVWAEVDLDASDHALAAECASLFASPTLFAETQIEYSANGPLVMWKGPSLSSPSSLRTALNTLMSAAHRAMTKYSGSALLQERWCSQFILESCFLLMERVHLPSGSKTTPASTLMRYVGLNPWYILIVLHSAVGWRGSHLPLPDLTQMVCTDVTHHIPANMGNEKGVEAVHHVLGLLCRATRRLVYLYPSVLRRGISSSMTCIPSSPPVHRVPSLYPLDELYSRTRYVVMGHAARYALGQLRHAGRMGCCGGKSSLFRLPHINAGPSFFIGPTTWQRECFVADCCIAGEHMKSKAVRPGLEFSRARILSFLGHLELEHVLDAPLTRCTDEMERQMMSWRSESQVPISMQRSNPSEASAVREAPSPTSCLGEKTEGIGHAERTPPGIPSIAVWIVECVRFLLEALLRTPPASADLKTAAAHTAEASDGMAQEDKTTYSCNDSTEAEKMHTYHWNHFLNGATLRATKEQVSFPFLSEEEFWYVALLEHFMAELGLILQLQICVAFEDESDGNCEEQSMEPRNGLDGATPLRDAAHSSVSPVLVRPTDSHTDVYERLPSTPPRVAADASFSPQPKCASLRNEVRHILPSPSLDSAGTPSDGIEFCLQLSVPNSFFGSLAGEVLERAWLSCAALLSESHWPQGNRVPHLQSVPRSVEPIQYADNDTAMPGTQ